MSIIVQPPIPQPPSPVPLPPDLWLAQRYGLPPAVAKLIADHAFAPCASWQERRL